MSENEEDYLEGICEFPAIVNNKPSQVIIANPFMTIDDLIQSVFVKGEDGAVKEVQYGLPVDGKIVVAALDGELTVKRLSTRHGRVQLLPANPAFAPIDIDEGCELMIWGVVRNVIHSL